MPTLAGLECFDPRWPIVLQSGETSHQRGAPRVEVSLGEWEGGEFRIRVAERDPVALQAVAEERWDVIPGAETMESFAGRVRAGVEAVVASAGPDVVVAAVVHGGVIGEACRQATGGIWDCEMPFGWTR